MSEVRKEATHISNKYKIQTEPIQFEWDAFLPNPEKDFLDISDEVLSCQNTQQHQSNSNVSSSMPDEI